ncbi:MAG TPA: vitamin K-dependent gamma-carboxylase [Bacteroidetes bacterium]|nr:vitamin K-dependent gamma-carboxylase [Bacteroidota bacterium]
MIRSRRSRLDRWRSSVAAAARAPVSGASLAAVRVAFGAVVVWEVWRYWSRGWIWRYYVEPEVRLTYFGWEWVPSLPYPALLLLFGALAGAGGCLALGVRPRGAAAACAVGLGWVFLLEHGRYLNHFYLLVLLAALLALLPTGAAYRWRSWRAGTVGAWAVWAVRAQLGLVYTYAAIAKLNADWLRGEPIATWLQDDLAASPLAFLLGWEHWGLLFAWGGIAIDGLAVPLLLWRRTRVPMALALTAFHLFNAWVFTIGVFPWLMIALTPIFFAPDWPERWRQRTAPRLRAASAVALRPSRPVALALAVFAMYQVLMPLRHWAYPGDVAWTEEGHRFSWRMKLRSKDATAAAFEVRTAEGAWLVDPADRLMPWQADKASTRPDLILAFAHRLRDEALAAGHEDVSVHAWIEIRLNGRPPQAFVDPEVDLAAQPRSLAPKPWILPLDLEGEGPRLFVWGWDGSAPPARSGAMARRVAVPRPLPPARGA